MSMRIRIVGCAAALAAAVAAGLIGGSLSAQNRKDYSIVSEASGHIALGLAIRKLDKAGTFMNCPAHPDDERNELLTLAGYGLGLRSIDVQNNRGEGGQNEIGPELFREIGVAPAGFCRRTDRRRRAVLHPRDRLRVFRDPNEVIEVGPRRDRRNYVQLFHAARSS